MKTLVSGGIVVGFDPGEESHVLYPDGELVFEGNTVEFVGRAYPGRVDEVIDASGCLVTPGFVNVHSCMDTSTFQFFFDIERRRRSGYSGQIRRRELFSGERDHVFGPAEIRDGANLAFLNMVRGGTTTMAGITSYPFKAYNDPVWEPEIYMEAAVTAGLRAYLSHMYRDRVDGIVDRERGREGLRRAVQFVEKYDGSFGDRIRGLLFPYTLDSNSKESLAETRSAADDLGVGIRMHFAQFPDEIHLIESEYGTTPVELLEEIEFLKDDVLLTHCLYPAGLDPTPEERNRALDTLASRGVNVGHCPWVLIVRGSGPLYLDSMSEYLRRGINVCLGTDTFPQDMISEMRWGAIMAKNAHGRRDGVGTAREVFDAATINGARWLGREDIGRLEAGSKADINIIELDDYNVGPLADPIRNLVYFGTGQNVRTVIVDGVKVVDDFHHLVLDEDAVVRASQPISDKVRETLQRWDESGSLPEQLPPPSYPWR
ncbi:MAG: amidohydrolase family protein [Bacillota bacterium]